MDEKKQYEPLFPKDLDYLNQRYAKFQQVLNSIDYELENSLKDKGPTPAPAPLGMRHISPDMRKQRMEYLGRTRERRVQGFKNGINKQIDGLEESRQLAINARFDFETSRHGFKDYSKDDLKAVKDIVKEDKVSFDYMTAYHFNKYQLPGKSVADEKENIDAWGDRFQNLLDYYRDDFSKGMELEIDEFDKD